MENTKLKELEKRVAALEKDMAQLLHTQGQPIDWKDWRLAVGKFRRSEISEEIDTLGREFREADRREAEAS